MTHDSGSARYEGMLSTVGGATYGAAMALVGAINLDTMIVSKTESEKWPF